MAVPRTLGIGLQACIGGSFRYPSFRATRLGRCSAQVGGGSGDSAAFFANHAFQEHIGRRTESQGLQNPHRIKAGRESGLHIAGAATVELAFLDFAAPGRARPQRFVARGHDVHVAVEDERAGRMFFLVLLAASRPARDYVETVVEGDAVVAERGM